jgi:hypothetical protein
MAIAASISLGHLSRLTRLVMFIAGQILLSEEPRHMVTNTVRKWNFNTEHYM